MTGKKLTIAVSLLCLFAQGNPCLPAALSNASARRWSAAAQTSKSNQVNDLKADLDAAFAVPESERAGRLEDIVNKYKAAKLSKTEAELLIEARAALGDEKLKAGDVNSGLEQFRLAVSTAPRNLSDRLFDDVISQIPVNLFLRNQTAAAIELARQIENSNKDNPKRLLAIAAFYLRMEQGVEAARVAEEAITLAPDMVAAHQVLGSAKRISFQLDAAASEFARALELDPKSSGARLSLADLTRANGNPGEALALYREQIAATPQNQLARNGIVLALFDSGKKEEAEKELKSELQQNPRNLQLLVGAAYWYASNNEGSRALELAQQAVAVEPRYTWADIAYARALLALRRPVEAEVALQVARKYGTFPTLDYELASALAAEGLYAEAAAVLANSFTVRNGLIQTNLGRSTPVNAANFIDLLASERRAAIFEPQPCDTEANARTLQSLLAFHQSLNPGGEGSAVDETGAVAWARDFVVVKDEMRAFRLLYVASRLLDSKVAFNAARDFAASATTAVDAGLNAPTATIATLGDELRDIRANAVAQGNLPAFPDVPRNTLSNILRGKIEDITGWALFNLGKTDQAIAHLRLAVSVLPLNSIYARTNYWRLGTALEARGDRGQALTAYLSSYDPQAPDPARRAIIEGVYLKVNGSLEGFDDKLGAAQAAGAAALVASQAAPSPAPSVVTPAPDSMAAQSNSPESSNASSVPAPVSPPADAPAESRKPAEVASSSRAQEDLDKALEPSRVKDVSPQPVTESSPGTKISTPPSELLKSDSESSSGGNPEVPSGPVKSSQEASGSALVKPAEKAVANSEPADSGNAATGRASSAEPAPAVASDDPCGFALDTDAVKITRNGGFAIVTVRLRKEEDLVKVSGATISWSDIVIFAQPGSAKEPGSRAFVISSVNNKPGRFVVTFKSPCGSKDVAVEVD